MKKLVVRAIEFLSGNRIRGQHLYGPPSLRWWYTGTKRFQHGGWICLNWNWYQRFRKA